MEVMITDCTPSHASGRGLLLPRLGFTDISLMECAKNSGNLILTKDLNLKLACISKSIPVLHFDILRVLSWFPN